MSDRDDAKQLTLRYKKNGTFDKQRKKLLENFRESETHANLLLKLKIMIENKIKQDPSILMKNKGKVGALIQGEIINHHMKNNNDSLLSIVDKDIQDKTVDSPAFHKELKASLRDIQRQMLGVSDEDYKKQLEEEAKAEQQWLAQQAEKEQEKEREANAEKLNFKMKSLINNYKVTKTPRFNFSSNANRQSQGNKPNDGQNNRSNSARGSGSSNSGPGKFMMY